MHVSDVVRVRWCDVVMTGPTRGEQVWGGGLKLPRAYVWDGGRRMQPKLLQPANIKNLPQETPKKSVIAFAVEQTKETGICENHLSEIKNTFYDFTV
jgi:hypothetical protein